MVVNLCLPHFQTTVQCNKLCADGYDVSNLLSRDPMVRRRGFKLEYFIRPPVHVMLCFQVQMEVCRIDIELWPWGMDQGKASRRLEIHTCSEPLPQFQQQEQQQQGCGQLKLVGRCELKDEVLVCFHHPSFRPRPPFSDPPTDPPAGSKQLELWVRGLQSLGSVTQLRVSIPYCGAASALGFKALAVWGLPARCCPPLELEKIKMAHFNSLKPSPQASAWPSPKAQSPLAPDPAASGLPIPEEFLDPLTQELMVLPMILPSGTVIDNSTLEEYQRREATWGRQPNDPFTGVPFTQDSKPLPNPLLKGRIDSLVLQTGCTGAGVRNSLLARLQSSRLLAPVNMGHPTTTPTDSVCPQQSHCEHNGSSTQQALQLGCEGPETSHKKEDNGNYNGSLPIRCKGLETSCLQNQGLNSSGTVIAIKRKRMLDVYFGHSFKSKGNSDAPRSHGPTTSSAVSPSHSFSSSKKPRTFENITCSSDSSGASHEQRLSDSLDQALTSALQGLPTFTPQSKQESATTDSPAGENRCGLCFCSLTVYPTSPPAYCLPCGHLLCRPCLHLKAPPSSLRPHIMCPTCSAPAPSGAITRVHH